MRILLADGQNKVRFALRVLLEQQPDVQVVGETASYDELLVSLKVLTPDVLLLDLDLPGLQTEQIAHLRELVPLALIVALSGRPEARRAALAAGAHAFVSKTFPPERLIKTLRSGAWSKGQQGINPLAG